MTSPTGSFKKTLDSRFSSRGPGEIKRRQVELDSQESPGETKSREVELDSLRVQELCESRDGRPGFSVLMSLTVSVDVKQH